MLILKKMRPFYYNMTYIQCYAAYCFILSNIYKHIFVTCNMYYFLYVSATDGSSIQSHLCGVVTEIHPKVWQCIIQHSWSSVLLEPHTSFYASKSIQWKWQEGQLASCFQSQ